MERFGWIFALSAGSDFGAPQDLIDLLELDLLTPEDPVREMTLFGRPGKVLPGKGDGIAFYHTKRADYWPEDPYKKNPRITAMGVIESIEAENEKGSRAAYRIKVRFDPEITSNLAAVPIVREGELSKLFEECGLKQGNIRTWYEVPRHVWSEFERIARIPLKEIDE